MGFRYRPRVRIGGVTFGKRGASIRTGIPGLTFQLPYTSADSGRSAFSGEPVPKMPTVSRLLANSVGFLFLTCLLFVFWVGTFGPWLAIPVATLLFTVSVYRPLFSNYAYGYKQEPIYATDRRYKTGRRYEGSRAVIDMSVTFPYDSKQRILSRIEGVIKMVILGTFLMVVYFEAQKPAITAPPKAALTINNISLGSSLKQIKRWEKASVKRRSDGLYYVDKTEYANEKGAFRYWFDHQRVNKIEFKPSDQAAYGRMLELLQAKYGPAQHSTDKAHTWKNDSLQLTLAEKPTLSLILETKR